MKATITNLNPVEVTYYEGQEPQSLHCSDYYDEVEDFLKAQRLMRAYELTKTTARVVNAANILGYKIVKGQKKFKSLSLGMTVEFEPEKRMIIKI